MRLCPLRRRLTTRLDTGAQAFFPCRGPYSVSRKVLQRQLRQPFSQAPPRRYPPRTKVFPRSDDTLGKRLCYESNFSIECLRKQAGNRTETALTDQSGRADAGQSEPINTTAAGFLH